MQTSKQYPIDGMYRIRSAITKPNRMMPDAGRNGTITMEVATKTFLRCQCKNRITNLFKIKLSLKFTLNRRE